MNKKMNPEEFHQYWGSSEEIPLLAGEYSEAQSENEKMKILEEYGLSEYKQEIEREIWLESWSADRFAEELHKPFGKVTTVAKFKELLNSMEFRDYEKYSLISAHIGGVLFLWESIVSGKSRHIAR